jgi:peptide/nickel transport system permease protein
MWRFIVRRLVFVPVIAFFIGTLTFLLLRVLPGDLATASCTQSCTKEILEERRAALGLNREIFFVTGTSDAPFLEFHSDDQYTEWVQDVVTGDMGRSLFGGQDVLEEITRRLPASFEIMFLTLLFSGIIGITFGILSAVMRNSPLDYAVRTFAVFGQSIPDFFLLTLLVVIPSMLWQYAAPAGGYVSFFDDPWTNLRLFVPPTLILSVGNAVGLMRLVRSTMLEVLRSDYVRTARAKGLNSRAVVVRHAFRNTLPPVITVLSFTIATAFSGSIILERVMNIDGLGNYFFFSVLIRDLPVVQFTVLYTALIVVMLNLLQDISYAYLDPRVRYN